MSSDNTELTFIRCTSCRSLIPAMSVRCRMCGADLQSLSPDQPATEAIAPAAVKQGTSKDADDHLDHLLEAQDVVAGEDDPINDFLNGSPDFDDIETGGTEDLVAAQPQETEDDIIDEELEKLDQLLEDLSATSAEEERPSDFNREPALKTSEEKLIESVSLQKPESRQEREAVQDSPKEVLQEPAPRQAPTAPRKLASKKQDLGGVKEKQHGAEGQIFGWFVSYDKSEGRSIELREGRFFISNEKLKSSDLLIEDDSVSTPHALITLSKTLGFQIQDLMSEHGLYIRRSDSKKYELIDDIEVVENGDWLRFGNIDYQVVLIPEA